MWQSVPFASFSGSDLVRWVGEFSTAGRWGLPVLLAVASSLWIAAIVGRSRARHRRGQEDAEQIRLGLQTSARRASVPAPAHAAPSPTVTSPQVAPVHEAVGEDRRDAKPRAPAAEAIDRQEDLINRIVRDAWGRALGGGRLAPIVGRKAGAAPVGSAGSRTPEVTARMRTAAAGVDPPKPRGPTLASVPDLVTPAVSPAVIALRSRVVPKAPEAQPAGDEPLECALGAAWNRILTEPRPEAARREHLDEVRAANRPTPPAIDLPSRAEPPSSDAPPEKVARIDDEPGRLEAALLAAREAHRARPSRSTLTCLLRLLSSGRRFRPEDGERLHRAVARHPDRAVLLHATGVFESMHGNPWAAIGLLRTALRLERDESIRSEIVRELVRLEAPAIGLPDPAGEPPDLTAGP